MKIVFVTDDSTLVTEIEFDDKWDWNKPSGGRLLGWAAMVIEIKEALLWTSNVEAQEKLDAVDTSEQKGIALWHLYYLGRGTYLKRGKRYTEKPRTIGFVVASADDLCFCDGRSTTVCADVVLQGKYTP